MLQKILLSLILIIGFSAQAELLKCDFNSDSNIKSKEKLLKTFTFEYWQAAQKEIKKLPTSLQIKGYVVGDLHFNNLGIYYDYTTNKAEIVVNDLDDSGYNYLIGDLLKYLAFLKKVDKNLDLETVIQSYSASIKGSKTAVPPELNALLNRSQFDFTQDYMKYYNAKYIEAEEFDANTLTDLQKQNVQHFMGLKLLKKLNDLKMIFRINDSGSSLGMERYEFIGSDAKGSVGIIEFKQLKCSATGNTEQQDLKNDYAKVKNYFQKIMNSNYLNTQIIYSHENNFYLVREKKNNPMKKLDIEKMKSAKIQEYANYYASILGQLHSANTTKEYVASLRENSSELLKTIKKINDEFKDTIGK